MVEAAAFLANMTEDELLKQSDFVKHSIGNLSGEEESKKISNLGWPKQEQNELLMIAKRNLSASSVTPNLKPMRKISVTASYEHHDMFAFKANDQLPNPYIIGVSGGAESGKSIVAKQLEKILGSSKCLVIHQTNFYKPVRGNLRRKSGDPDSEKAKSGKSSDTPSPNQESPAKKKSLNSGSHLSVEEQKQEEMEIQYVQDSVNFDTPEAIDWAMLFMCLGNLKSFKPFDSPVYNLAKKQRMVETLRIFP